MKMIDLSHLGYKDDLDLVLKYEISEGIFNNADHLDPHPKANLLDRFALIAFQEILRATLQRNGGPENFSVDDLFGMPDVYVIAGGMMARREDALKRAQQIACGALEQEKEELLEDASELCSEAEEESPAEQAN